LNDIIIPVLLSLILGPGVGQLYNKEYKKGAYLIGVSLVVLTGAVMWFLKALRPDLPADLTNMNHDALQAIMRNAVNHVVSGQGGTLAAYQTILFALWLYSVIDAYRGGLRRHNEKLSSLKP
jgi:hypothetical protein